MGGRDAQPKGQCPMLPVGPSSSLWAFQQRGEGQRAHNRVRTMNPRQCRGRPSCGISAGDGCEMVVISRRRLFKKKNKNKTLALWPVAV